MTSDGPTPAQRKMVHDQIIITTKITVGVTLIAVGVTIHLTSIDYISRNFPLFIGFLVAFVSYVVIGIILMVSGVKQANRDYGRLPENVPKTETKETIQKDSESSDSDV